MDIWLDSTHIKAIQKAVRFGLLSGVTTNPGIIVQSKRSAEQVLEDLLHYQEGPVAVQVVAESTAEMVQQGQNLYDFSNRMIVKVPVTKNGLEAIHLLARQGIPTMATVIFTVRQALMAALAGAHYVAPYLGRMEKEGKDPWQALAGMQRAFQNYRLPTKILGASLHTVEQAIKCAEQGIYGVTLREELFEKMLEDEPLTLQGIQQFAEEWKKADLQQSCFMA